MTVNGFEFLIYIFICSLCVFRRATDLCTLVFYPVAMLNLFISSRFLLLVDSLEFPTYIIMSSANRDSAFKTCFLDLFQWLEFPRLCIRGVVPNVLSLFPILEGSMPSFTVMYDVSYRFL